MADSKRPVDRGVQCGSRSTSRLGSGHATRTRGAFASDPERLARFEREAKTLAVLRALMPALPLVAKWLVQLGTTPDRP
jgi:hypothetical protein